MNLTQLETVETELQRKRYYLNKVLKLTDLKRRSHGHQERLIRCWGDSESSLSYTKIKECFQLFEVRCERLGGETPGAFKTIFISQNPSFDHCPSSPVKQPNNPATQGVRVSVKPFDFPHDETPEMNLTHPASLSRGFAQGVSSSLTSNVFKFECDLCFRWREAPGERGISKRLKVFSWQAHVMTTRKAQRLAAWRHEALITWRPNWRPPKNSLASSVTILFIRVHPQNVKSLLASL
jgi:hypothetical protein